MSTEDQAQEALKSLIEDVDKRVVSKSGGQHLRGTDIEKEAIRAQVRAAIERWTHPGSSYRNDVSRIEETNASTGWRALRLFGVLNGLYGDYAAGQMRTVEELVHADVFSDFLEMAAELLSKGYKDAAAVIIGSVLEEHLRKLAIREGLPTLAGKAHKKADAMNADLAKAGAYNKLEQKNVTAWLGVRNDAAHGNYGNYDQAQVQTLVASVRDFMVRNPA